MTFSSISSSLWNSESIFCFLFWPDLYLGAKFAIRIRKTRWEIWSRLSRRAFSSVRLLFGLVIHNLYTESDGSYFKLKPSSASQVSQFDHFQVSCGLLVDFPESKSQDCESASRRITIWLIWYIQMISFKWPFNLSTSAVDPSIDSCKGWSLKI